MVDEFYTSTTVPDGEEMQRRLDMVKYLESFVTEPIGVQLDTTSNSPTLQRIDGNGDTITASTSFFNKHVLFGGMRLCARNRATGSIIYENFEYDASTGYDLFVEYPTDRPRFTIDGDFYQWTIAPYNTASIEYNIAPFAVQRGGAEHSKIYIGAKEAYFYLDGATGKLGSASGKQPVTGGVSYTDLPSGSLTMTQAETYANNAGFGICNAWTYADVNLRMLIEYATFDIPTSLGLGVSNLAAGGSGVYSGKLTGADSIDSRVGTNGTGMGSGVNGETPIQWRHLENPYGNVFEMMIGLNMFHTTGTDGEGHAHTAGDFRVLKKGGTGTPAATLAYGDYVAGVTSVPNSTDNYISALQSIGIAPLLFMPVANAGTSSTGMCDAFYYPRYDPSIVLHGGYWAGSVSDGPFCMFANCSSTYSNRIAGCRLEYYPTV